MRLWRELTLGAFVVLTDACAYSGAETGPRRHALTSVHVAVVGDTAQTAAQITDAGGRRSGWVKEGPVQGVPGCGYSYTSDEGIPDDEGAVDSSDATAIQDSLQERRREGPPRSHSFGIRRPERGPGVLSEGGCDLLVESSQGGWVTLYAQAGQSQSVQCQTKLREDLKAETQYRWRVTWKAMGDSCTVKIARVSPEVAGTGAP